MRKPGFMGILQCINHFLRRIQKRPLPLYGIENIIKVESEFIGDKFLIFVFESSDQCSLWKKNRSHRNDIALGIHNVFKEIYLFICFEEDFFHTP